jgi:hypothetical protein
MKITIDKHYSRKKLQMWLDYEIGGAALIFLHYFAFPVFFILPRFISLILVVIIVSALIYFLMLIFKVLIREKRYGWIKLFFALVAGSGIITYLYLIRAEWMFDFSKLLISGMVSVVFFFFYACLLRLSIPSWYDAN